MHHRLILTYKHLHICEACKHLQFNIRPAFLALKESPRNIARLTTNSRESFLPWLFSTTSPSKRYISIYSGVSDPEHQLQQCQSHPSLPPQTSSRYQGCEQKWDQCSLQRAQHSLEPYRNIQNHLKHRWLRNFDIWSIRTPKTILQVFYSSRYSFTELKGNIMLRIDRTQIGSLMSFIFSIFHKHQIIITWFLKLFNIRSFKLQKNYLLYCRHLTHSKLLSMKLDCEQYKISESEL